MPRVESQNKQKNDKELANEQKGEKKCTCCHAEKKLTDFYVSASPLFSLDKRIPICKSCVMNKVVSAETGEIDEIELNKLLRQVDKPFFKDDLASAYAQFSKEHSYIDEKDVKKYGDKILGLYFKNSMLRQNKSLSYEDSEKMGFMHTNSNITISEKKKIAEKYMDIKNSKQNDGVKDEKLEELQYSDKWMGNYTETDIKKLDHYYESLENDYNIVTENHRDYAKKIAKASLQMDKTFDDMMNGIDGADKKYENATKAFDLLSKSAKFSESTRSVNDVGASSFSKVAAMVESYNWIPEHKPLKKDNIDEMIDYLSTITKSL